MTEEDQVSDDELQAIANWTNLSETTFLFKPTIDKCDYKLRIFTPANELPFAGHPTIGSCKAFLKFTGREEKAGTVLQECQLGIVTLSIADDKTISFKAEKADIEEISEDAIKGYQKSLDVEFISEPKLLQVGPKWIVYLVGSSESCYKAEPDHVQMANVSERYGHTGIILAGKKPGSKNEYEMRAFAPAEGVQEDPVCGSGSIALVRYLQGLYSFKETTDIKITQGGRVHRDGQISCQIQAGKDGQYSYSSGGDAIIVIEGSINL